MDGRGREYSKSLKDWCDQNGQTGLLQEWDYSLNKDLNPSSFPFSTSRKVWWICAKGHKWQASTNSRITKDKVLGCPYCSGHRVIKGETDFPTFYPQIAKEWHPTKNGSMDPTDYSCGSNVVAWWKCSHGHEWQVAINSRTGVKKSGCPYCSGRRTLEGYNDFKTWCLANNREELLDEWDYGSNTILPSQISPKNTMKVWWTCSNGHSYNASVGSRTANNTGCPICSGKSILVGFNDLKTKYPLIAKEWHPTKNGSLMPTDVGCGSSKKVWWKCSLGHEWLAAIQPRIAKGVGCPYCANKKVLKGYNDLATLRPELVSEWNFDRNIGLVDGNKTDISTPDKVTLTSGNKVWWKCSKGHEWQATIAHRTKDERGCPFCWGRYVITGETDLQTLYPDIAKEWNYERNYPLTPSYVTAKSEKKVWWKCSEGHEWKATLSHRTGDGNGCPFCSGRYAITGVNDIATLYPELLKEWDYNKNSTLKPECILPKSEKKVWWKCSKGHEWQTQVCVRVLGADCPRCSGVGTSLPEQGVAYYLESVCKIEQRIKIGGKEIDVFLPDYNIGIEYDGKYYHKSENEKREVDKNNKLVENGIKPVRIKESDNNRVVTNGPSYYIYYDFDVLGKNYEWAINQLCQWLSYTTGDKRFDSIDVDVGRDLISIRERLNLYRKDNSFVSRKPELLSEWNYDRNGILQPEMFSFGAGTVVWWKCSEEHEWRASISSRVRGSGCPYCSGRFAVKGKTDLVTLRPDVIEDWDYEKNTTVSPDQVSPGSNKKVWWKCSLGHSWKSSVSNRTVGTGCPYCARKKRISNNIKNKVSRYGSFLERYPEIAGEWHPTKNHIQAKDVLPSSNKKVWWRCHKGHEWEATIGSRTNGNCSCPYCSGRVVVSGENDLATQYPQIALEWNDDKNTIKPYEVKSGSGRKVWWKCSKGHEWEATISSRTSQGVGCPYCSGKKVLAGYNDLATLRPDVADEWDYDKNKPFIPSQFRPGAGKKVWWKCSEGHEWEATINNRTRGSGCPCCRRMKDINPK